MKPEIYFMNYWKIQDHYFLNYFTIMLTTGVNNHIGLRICILNFEMTLILKRGVNGNQSDNSQKSGESQN